MHVDSVSVRNDFRLTVGCASLQRHDGRHRSPWNEPECGLLYSRAMAHWNIFDQACGHVYDCTTEALSFDPRSDVAVSGGERMFKCFVSLNGGWGEFSQSGPAGLASGKVTLSCLFGTFTLKTLGPTTTRRKVSSASSKHSMKTLSTAPLVTRTSNLT